MGHHHHHHNQCNHSHHHHHSHDGSKNILLAFFLNASFSIIEFIGGYFTNSVAIYSDALHDLGDSLSLLFSYFAEKLSHKKADQSFTFGYQRFSVLAGLINGIILLLGSVYVLYEAVNRLQNPEPVHAQGMILLALLGMAVNGFAAYRLSKNEGINSKMVMYHMLEDLLGWVAVFIVSIILLFKPWYVLDSLLSILIALLILKGVAVNLFNVAKIFLQKFPDRLEREKIIQTISQYELVENVHFLQGWSLDDSKFNLTLHIRVAPHATIRDLDQLRKKIVAFLKDEHVIYSTIQFEGEDCVIQ
jgi:cobalt-zinc-cadmium efflux system protein